MELKSGTIHSFEDGTVKTGHFTGSAYKTIILTTGNKLTCFDLDFITGVEIGKEYTFPVEQKGSYTNIVGTVTPVIQTETKSPDSGIPDFSIAKEIKKESHVQMFPVPNKDTAIRKAVALKAAVEFLVGAGGRIEGDFTAEHVALLAKKFEEYLA